MSEYQQNINDFKPSELQLSFLESYLSQEVRLSIEQLCKNAGVDKGSYYNWIKKPAFNKWFYDQIEVNKHRFAPRIFDNIFSKAMSEKASVQDKELALRVLGLYTPTTKTITDNQDYEKILEEVLSKAKKQLEVI
jgi:hypothetical protein